MHFRPCERALPSSPDPSTSSPVCPWQQEDFPSAMGLRSPPTTNGNGGGGLGGLGGLGGHQSGVQHEFPTASAASTAGMMHIGHWPAHPQRTCCSLKTREGVLDLLCSVWMDVAWSGTPSHEIFCVLQYVLTLLCVTSARSGMSPFDCLFFFINL